MGERLLAAPDGVWVPGAAPCRVRGPPETQADGSVRVVTTTIEFADFRTKHYAHPGEPGANGSGNEPNHHSGWFLGAPECPGRPSGVRKLPPDSSVEFSENC